VSVKLVTSPANATLASAATVQVARTGGTATNGTDHSNYTTQTLTFEAGDGNGETQNVPLTPTNDTSIEGDETVEFELQNATGAASINTDQDEHTATITDDDEATVAFETSSSRTGEDDGPHPVAVKLSITGGGTLSRAVSVDVAVSGGTATNGKDYKRFNKKTATFRKGSRDGDTNTVTLTPKSDSRVEGDETVKLKLSNVRKPGRLGARKTHTVTIKDGERPAELTRPKPGAILRGSRETFRWNGGRGANRYRLCVGRKKGGQKYFRKTLGGKTVKVRSLPTDGSKVYVRLSSRIGSRWVHRDYIFIAKLPGAIPAKLAKPKPGSRLKSSSVRFKSSTGKKVRRYKLYIGKRKGSGSYFKRTSSKRISVQVRGLPRDGRKLYVRLFSKIGKGWVYKDYYVWAYKEASKKAEGFYARTYKKAEGFARPDLVVSSLRVTPPAACDEDPVTISVTVANTGTAPAGKSTLSVNLGEQRIGKVHVYDLSARESRTYDLKHTISAPSGGTYSVVATADAGGRVAEGDERNNSAETTLRVTTEF